MGERDFYRVKAICIEFGFSRETLRKKISRRELPPLEQLSPLNTRCKGWKSETFRKVKNRYVGKVGNVGNVI